MTADSVDTSASVEEVAEAEPVTSSGVAAKITVDSLSVEKVTMRVEEQLTVLLQCYLCAIYACSGSECQHTS